MTTKRPGHGGAREGAGRKPKPKPDYDDKFKKNVQKIARKLAKEYGMPIEEAALRMMYSPDIQDTVRASLWKSYIDLFTVAKSEQSVSVTKTDAPAIGLPPIKEDPALEVVQGGKK